MDNARVLGHISGEPDTEYPVPATPVPKLMNALLADLQSDAWTRGVKLVADVSTEILCDLEPTTIQGCLSELLGTLIERVGPGGSISVVTGYEPDPAARGGGWLRLEVNAPAVGAESLTKALAGAKRLLDLHGAVMEVHSTPSAWALRIDIPRATPAAQGKAHSRTAVVVDDDVDTQEFLSAILETQGYKVISVNDGFDALVVIERYAPDVVLTDILMPNMNGIDLVARIKAHKADLPVIVFSGYRDALVKNISGLPDRILPKPMSRDQVLQALTAVLPA